MSLQQIIETTPEQALEIAMVTTQMEDGAALLGQVFPDGIRLKPLNREQTEKLIHFLAELLNQPASENKASSAFAWGAEHQGLQ